MSKSSEREHTQFAYFRLNLCKQTAAVAAPAAVVSLRIRSMPYICMAVYDMCVFMRARSFKLPNVYIYIILIWACLQLFVLIALCVQRISVAVTLLLFICFCSFVFYSLDSCVLFTYNAFRTRLGHWFIFWTFFNMHLYMFEFVFVFHDVNGLLFAHNVKLQCRTL